MNKENNKRKKISRKNFFHYLGASVIGILTFSGIPYRKIFSNIKNRKIIETKAEVNINPDAVSRKKRSSNA